MPMESMGFKIMPLDESKRPIADEAAEERAESAASLGEEVLRECRTELMLAFRFLDTALWHLPFQADDRLLALDTNGRSVRFGPEPLLKRYANKPEEAVRDYLHVLLHCIFRHPFDATHTDAIAWSLACDIVVEGMCLELVGRRWASDWDDKRRAALDEVVKLAGSLNPHKIYRLLSAALVDPDSAERLGLSWGVIDDWRFLFFRDGHLLWARPRSEEDFERACRPSDFEMPENADLDAGADESAETESKPEGDSDDEDDLESGDQPNDGENADESEQTERSDDGERNAADEDEESGKQDEKSEEERAWEEISKQVEMGLEEHLRKQGGEAAAFIVNLALANRQTIDYASFLRQFATPTEEIKVNDDEFDYVFYTYGLKIYGDMPLVEPLEYQETNRVREFVIAIDTSGSTQGELVRTFVTRTCEILKETEEFGSEVNLHIVQCDARIQDDTKIETMRDLERYLSDFRIRGGGNTDFRPVFEYVQRLIDRGEFENLRGLIYFTDGLGTYPETMPPYDTAFVFVDDDPRERRVPPWAMKVVVDSESIWEI